MSKLDELIAQLCPDGVEYKRLEDVCHSISSPKKLKKDEYKKFGNIPIIDQGEIFIAGYTDSDRYIPKGEYVVFGDHSEHIKYVDFSFVQGADGLKILVAEDFILPKYIYYSFLNFYVKEANYKRHWTKAKTTEIPVPPIEIQREIVRILDTFTELTEELTEELSARRKQYEYYRDGILNFDECKGISILENLLNEFCPDGVEFKKVKDIFTRLKGTSITAGKMKEIESPDGEIRIFAGGKTVIDTHEKDIPKANITKVPAVLIQSRGIIDVVFYEKPFTFKNEMWAYTHENKITVKFLYYILKNNIQKFRDAASGMGSLPQISLPVTEDFVIPVLSIEVQSEIVRILDRFDKLCNDISEGLPAEISARKKQYEFYRNKLLSFKKKEARLSGE